MSLESLIKKRIKAKGPISIADYMELALMHPEFGYYTRKDPLGAAGDFTTSPEISQIFGELLGLWIARQWEVMGKPKCALVELGPGRGTLMSDALRATKKVSGFHEAISVHLVEKSPALKQKQWNALAGKHADINWHESIDELPQKPWLILANEFFDALPIRQFTTSASPLEGESRGAGWRERMIDVVDGEFIFSLAPKLAELPSTLTLPLKGGGNIIEYCEPAIDIISAIAAHIAKHSGVAMLIDYGYTQGSKGDSLQAMKNHAYHDVLKEPGEADLTAHVDFAMLGQAAKNAGAAVYGPMPQGKFLMSIGAGVRLQKLCGGLDSEKSADLISGLERLASPEKMGDLFKVIAITATAHPRPEGFS